MTTAVERGSFRDTVGFPVVILASLTLAHKHIETTRL